jgi:hypothetical protein
VSECEVEVRARAAAREYSRETQTFHRRRPGAAARAAATTSRVPNGVHCSALGPKITAARAQTRDRWRKWAHPFTAHTTWRRLLLCYAHCCESSLCLACSACVLCCVRRLRHRDGVGEADARAIYPRTPLLPRSHLVLLLSARLIMRGSSSLEQLFKMQLKASGNS